MDGGFIHAVSTGCLDAAVKEIVMAHRYNLRRNLTRTLSENRAYSATWQLKAITHSVTSFEKL